MLLKCYTQYVRKFEKFSISIGLEKVHSNPKKEQCNKNVQTTTHMHSHLTLCDTMDCSLPGSSDQVRVLE